MEHCYESVMCSVVISYHLCLHFEYCNCGLGEHIYSKVEKKSQNVLGNFERHPTSFSVVRARHDVNQVGVLKVTPQPQMSLTTILIKGDSNGENRIL